MKSHYESEADKEYHLYFKHSDDIAIAAHFHKNVEMLFVTKGEQTVFINGKSFTVKQGEGIFIKPYEIHSYAKNDIKAWVVVVSERYLQDYRQQYCKTDKEYWPCTFFDSIMANADITSLLQLWQTRQITGGGKNGNTRLDKSAVCPYSAVLPNRKVQSWQG